MSRAVDLDTIKLGEGLGDIRFQMRDTEILALLGDQYGEIVEDWGGEDKALILKEQGVELDFCPFIEDFPDKMVTDNCEERYVVSADQELWSITCTRSTMVFQGELLIGKSIDEIKALIAKAGLRIKYEKSYSSHFNNDIEIVLEDIRFNFKDKVLVSVDMSAGEMSAGAYFYSVNYSD